MDILGETGGTQSAARELGISESQAASGAAAGGGAPGLASILDLDGDGNPVDDILGLAGKLMR